MDTSSYQELVFDPSGCSNLSLGDKRRIVYEVSKWSDSATDILRVWSRHDILQVLCAELGKERKYTGLTKSKLIEQLLKIVYEKKSLEGGDGNASDLQPSSENGERTPKRQRKFDNSPVVVNAAMISGSDAYSGCNPVFCKNSACKAKMNKNDAFCKRCSCCICREYDDNKDPSLWLICNSDPPFHRASCGMSCHLECALRHENSGISKDRLDKGLDGSFCCVSCGKVNDLLGAWRKQLVVARDTRRVDILCYRLSLCQKIIAGTKHYQNLSGIIDEAVEKLEEEVGPLTGLPVKRARGIVNRLSSGPEIQCLCASAVESLDTILSERASDIPSDLNVLASELVRFEDIRASSLKVVLNYGDSNMGSYMLWHRKAEDLDYPQKPTGRLLPNTKFLLMNLTPGTEYFLKVVTLDKDREVSSREFQFKTVSDLEVERSQSPATNCSSLSNPSSVEDEANNIIPINNGNNDGNNDKEATALHEVQLEEERCITKGTSSDHGPNTPQTNLGCALYPDSSDQGLQITPYRTETVKDASGRKNRRKITGKDIEEEPQAGSSSKKRSRESLDDDCTGIGDKDFEYYVKAIRYLECDGHIDAAFRQKFLTWFSLRATPQEVRVVKVFIDTFSEDPQSLAEQLVDTFTDVVSNKQCSTVPSGFCLKLWH